jgi:hypothetical protein
MFRSPPPRMVAQRTEKKLEGAELEMLKYLGINLNVRADSPPLPGKSVDFDL